MDFIANQSPETLINLSAAISTIIASIAVCITAVFVWRQIRIQALSLTNEDRRLIRESTIFVFEALQADAFRRARREMLDLLNKKNDLPTKRDDINALRTVLNTYEMLGLSVKMNSIDEEVWKSYWCGTLLRDWERLLPFIESERKRFDNPHLYCQTEFVVSRWRP